MTEEDSLISIQADLKDIKQHLYLDEASVAVRIDDLEKRMLIAEENQHELRAIDRMGQWRLTILLVSALLGFVGQIIIWLTKA